MKFHYSLPEKEFYSNLTTEDITDGTYKHGERVWKYFWMQNLGQYHDLYMQSNKLLLADVFVSSRNYCIQLYRLDLSYFLPVSRLALQFNPKKTKFELKLLTDKDTLLMVASASDVECFMPYISMQ